MLHRIGQTPHYERFPVPVAGDGEEVATVAAAALKPSDRGLAGVAGEAGAQGDYPSPSSGDSR